MIIHINTAKTWRGGEQQLFYLANGLLKKNIQQIVVCQPNSVLAQRCNAAGIPYKEIKIRGEWDLLSVYNIYKLTKLFNDVIIHAHTARAHTIGLLVKFLNPSLCLIVSRRVDFHINKSYFSKKKYLTPYVDRYLCVSNTIKNILLSDGVKSDKVQTVYSGIDLSRFQYIKENPRIRAEFSISDSTAIIGNIAALVDHKDQKTLLYSISKIKTNQDFILMIVGDGDLFQFLNKLTIELGLSKKVIFTGYRTDILSFLNSFDIFTLTSKEEGLGTSVLDAMASGLPVVATRGGGISEMLTHNHGALLTEVGDSDTLAEYFSTLIDDKDKRLKMGQYNSKEVGKFSVENTINQTLDVYKTFLEKK